MKLLEENTRFSEFSLNKISSGAKPTKYFNNDKLDFIKINFCSSQDAAKKKQVKTRRTYNGHRDLNQSRDQTANKYMKRCSKSL